VLLFITPNQIFEVPIIQRLFLGFEFIHASLATRVETSFENLTDFITKFIKDYVKAFSVVIISELVRVASI